MPNLFASSAALSLQETNTRLNELVAKAMATQPQPPRRYLGASIIGYECQRRSQYAWWCAAEIESKTRLVFEKGHLLEWVVKSQLEMIGFNFAPAQSLEFKALDGILQGHADGVIIAGPKLPGLYLAFPLVWENKAVSAKNYRAVDKHGLLAVYPHYAAQVSLYQRFLNKLNAALVTIVNSDNGETLHFQQPFDVELADRAIENAKVVIEATKRGELLPRAYRDPSDWRCVTCAHRRRCWGALLQAQGGDDGGA
jgi:hypothetical protein